MGTEQDREKSTELPSEISDEEPSKEPHKESAPETKAPQADAKAQFEEGQGLCPGGVPGD